MGEMLDDCCVIRGGLLTLEANVWSGGGGAGGGQQQEHQGPQKGEQGLARHPRLKKDL